MNERTLFNEQKGSKSDYEYEIFSLKRTGNIKRERESCYTCWYCDLDSAGTATKQVFSGGGWLGGWLVRGSNSMKWAMIENLGTVSKVSLPSCDWGDGGCRLRVSFVRSRTLVTLGEEGWRSSEERVLPLRNLRPHKPAKTSENQNLVLWLLFALPCPLISFFFLELSTKSRVTRNQHSSSTFQSVSASSSRPLSPHLLRRH